MREGPDTLPAELAETLASVRPARRYLRTGDIEPPGNFFDSLLRAALVCPTTKDLAAFYFVSEPLFAKWRKDNPKIDIIIAQAKQVDTQEVLQAVRERALEGSATHAKIYLERTRPDLHDSSAPVINTNVKVTVLPTPQQEITKPPNVIEGQAEERTFQPKIPERENAKTPLFNGKDLSIPEAEPAKGLTRG